MRHQKTAAAFSGPARGILERTGEAGDVLSLAMCDYRSGAGHRRARWTSASKPSWPTFSRSRAKTLTRSARGCEVAFADCEEIFRAQETNKRMRDKAADACRALCRARIVEEMQRRKRTPIAEHLRLVLSVIDRQVL